MPSECTPSHTHTTPIHPHHHTHDHHSGCWIQIHTLCSGSISFPSTCTHHHITTSHPILCLHLRLWRIACTQHGDHTTSHAQANDCCKLHCRCVCVDFDPCVCMGVHCVCVCMGVYCLCVECVGGGDEIQPHSITHNTHTQNTHSTHTKPLRNPAISGLYWCQNHVCPSTHPCLYTNSWYTHTSVV